VALRVASLDKSIHNRDAFDCGAAALNDYLKTQAARHQKQNVSRVYLLIDDDRAESILGFYALSAGEITRSDLDTKQAKKLPPHPVPVTIIGRLAVHEPEQGCGHGTLLLVDAISRSVLISEQAGVRGIVVDAKDEKAKAFYQRFGFTDLPEHPMRLLLPVATALQSM
jgi:GNAT superfamily N-acetyltransferase